MKIFTTCYDKMIELSKRRLAPHFLASIAFVESSVFPVPPDLMLISMGLAKPQSVWQYAWITTIFSVLGGILGYFIGVYALNFFLPFIQTLGYYESYLMVKRCFDDYGVWFVFVAGFTPIPYKLFTIAAGAMNMALLPFILASFVGRGMRFFLVSALLFYKGEKIEQRISKHVEWLSWSLVAVIGLSYGVYHFI